VYELRRDDSHDLYEILEVSPRASHDVIQAAYRVLARTAHPDRNPGADAEQRIRQINAAWEVLGDPSSRARYDLEALRARRRERAAAVPSTDGPRSPRTAAARPRPRALQRAPELTRPPVDDRFRLRFIQTVVLLAAMVVLGAIMLFVVWAALDAAVGDDKITTIDRSAVFTRPLLDTGQQLSVPRP
jgi:hypothetical protein